MTKAYQAPKGIDLNKGKDQRIVVRNVELSEGHAQRVVFRTRPLKNRVTCRTKGNPTIYVFPDGKGYLAMTKTGEGASAKRADVAFAKAVASYWS